MIIIIIMMVCSQQANDYTIHRKLTSMELVRQLRGNKNDDDDDDDDDYVYRDGDGDEQHKRISR